MDLNASNGPLVCKFGERFWNLFEKTKRGNFLFSVLPSFWICLMQFFVFRGEKAFCSHECRYEEMLLEESEDKLGFDGV